MKSCINVSVDDVLVPSSSIIEDLRGSLLTLVMLSSTTEEAGAALDFAKNCENLDPPPLIDSVFCTPPDGSFSIVGSLSSRILAKPEMKK